MRRLLKLIAVLLVLAAIGGLGAVAVNNRPAAMPDPDELRAAQARAIEWLTARDLASDNPMLWWMVKEAVVLADDPALRATYDRFDCTPDAAP